MKYNKSPITISEQIITLKERGLTFQNEEKAKDYLSNISYYRLRAYTYPFQNNSDNNHTFNSEISFEEIIELYVFDRKLRLSIFDAIEKIEIALRTQIIYHFALSHGSHWQHKAELYRDSVRFVEHLSSLQKEINRSHESFIDHYKSKYTQPNEPPCWMSLEVSSFGILSKIFQNLKKGNPKLAILEYFGLHEISILENWIHCFSTLRNICAHHGRVWNRRLIPIKLPTNPKYKFLQNKPNHTVKIYSTLSCIEYILQRISPNSTLKYRLRELMRNCPLAQSKDMGFPTNWINEELWN